ncbi:shikimate dehydrogenase [Pseudomonas sp. Marseille-QA0892]
MDRYAVFGNPIAHSKSPRIHALFAEETGQLMDYRPIQVPLDAFGSTVTAFFSEGHGANVTVPFKEDAWRLAGQRSERAERAGAVNTLVRQPNGILLGDNTDGAGLVRDITVNAGVPLVGKRILLLGAGGAARGVLQPLLAQTPSQLVIANRTVERAQLLAELFGALGPVSASGFATIEGSFDVIINATSASLAGEMPSIPDTVIQSGHTVCYDMMYGSAMTVFNTWAAAHGAARTIDGLGMLVEQAAEAFALWRGVRPDSKPVLELLRRELMGNS